MDHFDEFRKQDYNRGIEGRAVPALNVQLATCEAFYLKTGHRKGDHRQEKDGGNLPFRTILLGSPYFSSFHGFSGMD